MKTSSSVVRRLSSRSRQFSQAKQFGFASNRKQHGLQIEYLEARLALSAVPFLDVAPPTSYSHSPRELTVVGDQLYFVADDSQFGTNAQLWKTNGTTAGTGPLTSQPGFFRPERLTAVGESLFFSATHSTYGVDLWTSNGTSAGTRFVADVNPNNNGGPGPGSLTDINGTLYFNGGWWSDVELWRSDGTAGGTREVADVNPTGSAGPNNLIAIPGGLLFTANDGQHGFELWRSNGTAGGTTLVKDINEGSGGSIEYNNSDARMTRVGDHVFFTADDGIHGMELWRTDGTGAGTTLVADAAPNELSTGFANLVELNGNLFFGASSGATPGLYLANVDNVGVTLVKEFMQIGPIWSVGESLYFGARTNANGWELWKSDGSATGTVLVADINSGEASSSPWILETAPLPNGGNAVFFLADDGEHGVELWRTDGTAPGTVMIRDFAFGSNGIPYVHEMEYLNGYVYFVLDKVIWRTSVVNVGAPAANAGGPYSLVEGNSLTLDATATTDPDTNDVLEYSWDVNGDGRYGDATGVQPTLTWQRLELLGINSGSQTFQVRVKVHDGNGGESISQSTTLSVEYLPPTITNVRFGRSAGSLLPSPGFMSLGDLPGSDIHSFATDVSADGNVIVGRGTTADRQEAFRWTPTTGMQPLGVPEGDAFSSARAVSADGSVIIGVSRSDYPFSDASVLESFSSSDDHPFGWTAETGITVLPIPSSGYGASTPNDVSADGSLIVGGAYWDDWTTGVQWSMGSVNFVGALPDQGSGGPANVVSADGSTIAGVLYFGENYGEVYRATTGDNVETLGFSGIPTAISADGNVLVGETFRWTASGGLDGSFSGPEGMVPLDVSADGSVVIGKSDEGAFIWREGMGWRLVADELADRGIVLDGVQLIAATGVSANGQILVGYSVNEREEFEAWRADLAPTVAVAVGDGNQLRPLAQEGLDEILVSFSESVVVAADDLELRGVNQASYAIADFHYDRASHSATWRLTTPIASDRLELVIHASATAVRDLAGNLLDGEWNNPMSISDIQSNAFPSGNGAAGGDFVFHFNVLPGDVDGDSLVGLADLAAIQRSLGSANLAVSPRADLDGDGHVNRRDIAALARRFGDALESAPSQAPAAVVAVSHRSTPGRSARAVPSRRPAIVRDPARPAELSTELSTELRAVRSLVSHPRASQVLRARDAWFAVTGEV